MLTLYNDLAFHQRQFIILVQLFDGNVRTHKAFESRGHVLGFDEDIVVLLQNLNFTQVLEKAVEAGKALVRSFELFDRIVIGFSLVLAGTGKCAINLTSNCLHCSCRVAKLGSS